MIYLASPYWHEDPAVRKERYQQIALISRALLRRKLPVFSPIVHGHAISELVHKGNPPPEWPFSHSDWLDLDFQYLSRSSSMLIAELEGHGQSRGVQAEVRYCNLNFIPIMRLSPSDCLNILGREAGNSWPQPD